MGTCQSSDNTLSVYRQPNGKTVFGTRGDVNASMSRDYGNNDNDDDASGDNMSYSSKTLSSKLRFRKIIKKNPMSVTTKTTTTTESPGDSKNKNVTVTTSIDNDSNVHIYQVSSPSEQTAATQLPTPLSTIMSFDSPFKNKKNKKVSRTHLYSEEEAADEEEGFEVMDHQIDSVSNDGVVAVVDNDDDDDDCYSESSNGDDLNGALYGDIQNEDGMDPKSTSTVIDESSFNYSRYEHNDIAVVDDDDDSAELPPLHIDDEAIKRIRERLAYLDDEDNDDTNIPSYLDDQDGNRSVHSSSNVGRRHVTGGVKSPVIVKVREGGHPTRVDTPVLDGKKTFHQSSYTAEVEVNTDKKSSTNLSTDEIKEASEYGMARNNITATSLIAPSVDAMATLNDTSMLKAAVDPKEIASFNKLKAQVEMAAKEEEKRKREKKIQDRRVDVNGYKDLWNEYQNIEEKMNETTTTTTAKSSASSQNQDTRLEDVQQKHPQRRANAGEGLLLHDPSTWFVDFRAMNSSNQVDDESRGNERIPPKVVPIRSQQSAMSRLSHSDQISQQQLFQKIALERKRRSGAYAVGSKAGDMMSSNNYRRVHVHDDDELSDSFESTTQSSSQSGTGISYTSTNITGFVIPFISGAFSDDNNPGGTQEIHSPADGESFDEIMNSAEEPEGPVSNPSKSFVECEGQQGQSVSRDCVDDEKPQLLDAPTPVASNQAVRDAYCPKYSVPSVCIDSSKAGEVRWRNFPVDQQLSTRRKLLFEDEDDVKEETEICPTTNTEDDSGSDSASESEDPSLDMASDSKPKIVAHDPSIAFLSASEFLRMGL